MLLRKTQGKKLLWWNQSGVGDGLGKRVVWKVMGGKIGKGDRNQTEENLFCQPNLFV